MNKQEAIKRVEQMGEYERFVDEPVSKKSVLNIISQIHVEKEKLYTVEIPNPNNEYCMNVLIRLPYSGKITLVALHRPNTSYLKNKEYQLTESEIKEDFDFLWQFKKEVEEK